MGRVPTWYGRYSPPGWREASRNGKRGSRLAMAARMTGDRESPSPTHGRGVGGEGVEVLLADQ